MKIGAQLPAMILAAAVGLQGCAAVALTAGSIAGGTGVNHTLGGISYKTFAAPIADVRVATLKTLNRMEIPVEQDSATDEGWEIAATAADRDIDIEFDALTPTTTRMRVVVSENVLFKDSATATEIILQTAETLDRQQLASQ